MSLSHCLVFLGGLQGLEPVIESDESLSSTSAVDLFDYYVNVCPDQGSRTIRTEVSTEGPGAPLPAGSPEYSGPRDPLTKLE